jgi:hypothetical protein
VRRPTSSADYDPLIHPGERNPAITQRNGAYASGEKPCVTPKRTAVKLKLQSGTLARSRSSAGTRRTKAQSYGGRAVGVDVPFGSKMFIDGLQFVLVAGELVA